MADLDPRLWEATSFRIKREVLLAANDLFEEAEGKAKDAQPKAFVAGNWGSVLRDLANTSRDPSEADRQRRDATRLLDIAVRGAPGEEAWLLNRVYLEQNMRKGDPAGFAAYCEGMPRPARVAVACGKGLFSLVMADRVSVAGSERERLVCKAAKWAGNVPSIQAECERAKRKPRR